MTTYGFAQSQSLQAFLYSIWGVIDQYSHIAISKHEDIRVN